MDTKDTNAQSRVESELHLTLS